MDGGLSITVFFNGITVLKWIDDWTFVPFRQPIILILMFDVYVHIYTICYVYLFQ